MASSSRHLLEPRQPRHGLNRDHQRHPRRRDFVDGRPACVGRSKNVPTFRAPWTRRAPCLPRSTAGSSRLPRSRVRASEPCRPPGRKAQVPCRMRGGPGPNNRVGPARSDLGERGHRTPFALTSAFVSKRSGGSPMGHECSPSVAITPRSAGGDRVRDGAIVRRRRAWLLLLGGSTRRGGPRLTLASGAMHKRWHPPGAAGSERRIHALAEDKGATPPSCVRLVLSALVLATDRISAGGPPSCSWWRGRGLGSADRGAFCLGEGRPSRSIVAFV